MFIDRAAFAILDYRVRMASAWDRILEAMHYLYFSIDCVKQ